MGLIGEILDDFNEKRSEKKRLTIDAATREIRSIMTSGKNIVGDPRLINHKALSNGDINRVLIELQKINRANLEK